MLFDYSATHKIKNIVHKTEYNFILSGKQRTEKEYGLFLKLYKKDNTIYKKKCSYQ